MKAIIIQSRESASNTEAPLVVSPRKDTVTELYHLPEDIRAEFLVKEDGRVVARSWSAVARLAGVSHQTIRDRLIPRINTVQNDGANSLPESLKPLIGMDLTPVTTELSEIVISCIVNYYAWQSTHGKNETAKRVALALNAVGVRAFFQLQPAGVPRYKRVPLGTKF